MLMQICSMLKESVVIEDNDPDGDPDEDVLEDARAEVDLGELGINLDQLKI
jgi:hypothetical protein